MTVLRVDATIQGDRSASSELADVVLDHLVAAHPDTRVVRRHLGQDPLPADAWAAAVSAGFVAETERTQQQRDGIAIAEQVAGELQEATSVVLAMPLYNWGVSQHVKTWVDLAIAGAPYGSRLLEGTPTVLVTTRGGAYGEGTPRHGWDHNTDYLRRVLAEVWGADLTVIERELTLAGVNPAMDPFVEAAALLHKQAQEAAAEAGAALAARRAA